jgi:hypothetical protein
MLCAVVVRGVAISGIVVRRDASNTRTSVPSCIGRHGAVSVVSAVISAAADESTVASRCSGRACSVIFVDVFVVVEAHARRQN